MALAPVTSPSNLFNKPSTVSPANIFKATSAPQMSMAPAPAPMGARAVTPTANVSKPATTLPAAQKAPASPGSYNGTAINPGTDAQIQAQMASIDKSSVSNPSPILGANGASQGPSYPGLMGQQILKAQGTTPPVPTPPPAPSFSGYVGNVAGQAGALNTQAGNINTTAQQIGSQGQMTPEEVRVRQQLAGITGSEAADSANIETHPGVGGFAMGRDAINLANQEAIRSSLGQQLSGYAAQRTANTGAYTAQANAQNQAAGVQNQAGALYGNAAGYAAPNVTTPGQAVFNPLTGTYTSASSGGGTPTTAPSGIDQNSWNQYIQAYASGNVASIPGTITGNANLAGQLQAAVQAQNPNYDYATATGSAGARASNAGLAGTATPNAYNSIYTSALNDYTNLQQSVQNVDQFGNLLTSNMTAGGINPTDVKYFSKTLAEIRGQLSSDAQAQYDTTLAALKSKVSGMLAVGGSETPTALTADAQKILDGSLPLSALNDVLGRIQTEGNILLQNQAGKVNTAKSGTMGPTSPQGGGSNTGAITWDSILSH